MASVIESLATWLEGDGFSAGATASTVADCALQAGRLLDEPDLQAALYEREFGQGPALTFRAGMVAVERFRLQMLVRGPHGSYLDPRSVALRGRRRLAALADETIGGIRILAVVPDGSVFDVGPDETDRPLFSANFIVHHEPEA